MRFSARFRGAAAAALAVMVAAVALGFGGIGMGWYSRVLAADMPQGARAEAWKKVQTALEEGKPKSALEALAGVEQAAIAEKAWAEASRAIATRVFTETGDQAEDESDRIVRLAAAIQKAPPETRSVLEAIRANWTWGYYQANQWRYQERTQGGADASDISKIAAWDLRTIVGEIRTRFAVAVGLPGSPERLALQKLPVAEWDAIIKKGTMPDAYRPTVWDVLARDALTFAASGERGLMAPEDAFEIDPASPALGTPEEFLEWKPEDTDSVTDKDSPLLEAASLFRALIAFHAGDADRSALLSADLDRILWAAEAAVGEGVADRKEAALTAFIERAGDHEMAAEAMFHLASMVQEQGDLVRARKIALEAVAAHPKSHGGVQCANLVGEIEAKSLSLATEKAWAAPFPPVRVTYKNLEKVHLRVCKADWEQRLREGSHDRNWFNDQEKAAILRLPRVREKAVDLPATPDYQERSEDIDIAATLDAGTLEPGAYWVIASHDPGFGANNNEVSIALVWVTRLAVVVEQQRQRFEHEVVAEAARVGGGRQRRRPPGPSALPGYVVDLATGEPVAGADVTVFEQVRDQNQQRFAEKGKARTDADGRFELNVDQGREFVVVAKATIDRVPQAVTTARMNVWQNVMPSSMQSIVLVTDRGIHRPGQIVFYKGIVCQSRFAESRYAAMANTDVTVTFRDANGREVAKANHKTSANGSFDGNFPIPAGGLPGQWSIQAVAGGAGGGTGVRVEEYKRPKFKVELAAPETSVPLGGDAKLSGKAMTYTGLPVADALVRWRVERSVRFPAWCRWFFPWLPFDGGAQRIARGTAKTDASGSFTITFPARPDRSVPKDSLPVFSFEVVADVTDGGGETRSDDTRVNVGYTDVEASVSAAEWQATTNGEPAAVAITLGTTTLDGKPRAGEGTLKIHRLVQPATVDRGDLLDRPTPVFHRRRPAKPVAPKPDPADPQTWADGEQVVTADVATDATNGRATETAHLPAGIYRATFEIPAKGDVPAVKATTLIEVIDPAATTYGVKRAFVMKSEKQSVEPESEFSAIVGTGYDAGRVLVEISQSGQMLERFWTKPGATQWPVTFTAIGSNRGGFTVRAWMVRDGRLHEQSQVVDVPWTDKQLAITWERFTRRTQPGAKEVWRAKITSVADPVEGPAKPQIAEMLALAYDESLDALAQHGWPGSGLMGMFRREWGGAHLMFTNQGERFQGVDGSFDVACRQVPEMTFRILRDPFGGGGQGAPFPMFGLQRGGGGGGRMMAMARSAPMAAEMFEMGDAVPAEAMPKVMPARSKSNGDKRLEQRVDGRDNGEGKAGGAQAAAAPPPRKNLVETAFFLPTLSSDADGIVTIEFTLPDTLTTWKVKGLAHDAKLRSGVIGDTCISAKDLMVEPMVPRFLREGDVVSIPVKVSNTSTGRLSGTVRFSLADARTNDSRDSLIEGPKEQAFDVAAGESKPVVFIVKVADGTDVLKYLATGTATLSGKQASDGEEAYLPVLPRRVPVTETIPIIVRGPGERAVKLDRLATSKGSDIQSQSLVVQAVSNPAWYGVMALPVIMEDTDESTETLFTRLYANTRARHLATSDPKIARIFEQWRGTDALESPLDKNTDLVKTLLAETPWVRDAVDEKEARARIALLFDANRAANESRAALDRLQSLRNGDGGWPWFPGGSTCDSVTLGIIAGFGRLRSAGVDVDVQPAVAALPWLDRRLVEERDWAIRLWKDDKEKMVLTPIGVYALYARSFFTQDSPAQGQAAEAIQWALDVGRKCWVKLDARRSQGHLSIALARSGDKKTALSIIGSLKQRAVDAEVKPGEEKESWQGMWWKDPHPSWWSWAYAPIATQAIMIEAFDEVAGDKDSVEAMKVWLLSQKRTSKWPGSRSTADAVGALFGRGDNLLASSELVTATVGDEKIVPEKVEAGTGFFETRFVRREITPAMASVTLSKPDKGVAFGGVHWLYLDDISKVPAAGREELAIEKKLFVKQFTKAGPELVPAGDGTAVEVGDELVVRLVVTSDRDYEFLELADHRPSLTEPVDVLSGWRWGDGAGWYVAIRDASTQLFFERLPRGTHVFEYSLRVAHRGTASSGFAKIQSRYAPEFSAHSASVSLEVK
jgi:hypothetical protein